jgi:hypothetical protein
VRSNSSIDKRYHHLAVDLLRILESKGGDRKEEM